jgi:2-oxoisovalerate dehydrogenase E1 component alpha subunit
MALEGGGKPVLIEAMSYRVSHHSTSDDSFAYRSRVEVEDWKRRDNPITRLRKWLERQKLWDEEKERDARSRIRQKILEAFRKAEAEKKPPLRRMFEDVYEELTEEAEGQIKQLNEIIEKYPNEYDVEPYEGGKDGLTKNL